MPYYDVYVLDNMSSVCFKQLREQVWSFLRSRCIYLRAMDCNSQFREIFTFNVFNALSDVENQQFFLRLK